MVRATLLCVSFATSMLGAPLSRQAEAKPLPTAIVHIVTVDVSGNEIPSATVTRFEPLDDQPKFKGKFVSGTAQKVPYGMYRLRASANNFWSSERQVTVLQPEVWVVIELQFGVENGPPRSDLKGVVSSGSKHGKFWVRLSGLYSNEVFDEPVDDSGSFQLGWIPQGQYILIVREADHVLKTEQVTIPASHSLQITLP